METFFIVTGVAFGAIGVVLFLSARSKYKWPKEKGHKREWMTNGQYINSRIRLIYHRFKWYVLRRH